MLQPCFEEDHQESLSGSCTFCERQQVAVLIQHPVSSQIVTLFVDINPKQVHYCRLPDLANHLAIMFLLKIWSCPEHTILLLECTLQGSRCFLTTGFEHTQVEMLQAKPDSFPTRESIHKYKDQVPNVDPILACLLVMHCFMYKPPLLLANAHHSSQPVHSTETTFAISLNIEVWLHLAALNLAPWRNNIHHVRLLM